MYATILLALDGSPDSRAGGSLALALARRLGSSLLCTHVYDAGIHESRFREMEPGLPERYQDPGYLRDLRSSHDSLIAEGFHALSRGYMEAFLREAAEAGVCASEEVAGGRNYVEILARARESGTDLIVLGASGLGRQGDDQLGSTALRVLRRAPCDVLLARSDCRGGVLAGTDGSDGAVWAVRRAATWARTLHLPLHVAAAYDPAFHRHIFQTMAGSLAPERQREVGLERQEELHEELIDEGLGTLYRMFLEDAVKLASTSGVEPRADLLEGKGYRALVDHGAKIGAGLLVVGRYGHNREEISDIGSHAEAVARLARTNVLVTAPPPRQATEVPRESLEWEAEALACLEHVPGFARPMARKAVEESARADGASRVSEEIFRRVAERFGMGDRRKG